MSDLTVKKAVLPWWAAGLLLGLIQVLAIGVKKPLGVSTQFVVVDTKIISAAAPEYIKGHSLIHEESKYHKLGYGFWLDVGLIGGALIAALATGRFKISSRPVWW
ncbi:MAG: YeeE/YedE thiosulfate transporter family protein, partial [Planctomycetota bacterium]